jgi:hypothetical protein
MKVDGGLRRNGRVVDEERARSGKGSHFRQHRFHVFRSAHTNANDTAPTSQIGEIGARLGALRNPIGFFAPGAIPHHGGVTMGREVTGHGATHDP